MSCQREFERRLRVAVVGIGSHSYRNILPVLHFLPVELAAVCNHSDRMLAERTAAEYGCRSYQDPDLMYERENLNAVLFSVSASQHPRFMAQALGAGLHCWVEKPAAMTSGELFALQEKAGDRVVMVGYKKAFMPAVRSIGSFLCAMKMVWGPIFYILRMA